MAEISNYLIARQSREAVRYAGSRGDAYAFCYISNEMFAQLEWPPVYDFVQITNRNVKCLIAGIDPQFEFLNCTRGAAPESTLYGISITYLWITHLGSSVLPYGEMSQTSPLVES
jgi:hypothetical protein